MHRKSLFVLLLVIHPWLVCPYKPALLDVYGFGGGTFGADATSKAVKEAWAKYMSGEEDSMEDLILNIATLALCDIGGMAASSVITAMEEILQSRLLDKTTDALTAHNLKLYDDAKDMIRVSKGRSVTQAAIKAKIESSVADIAAIRETGLTNFGKDLKNY